MSAPQPITKLDRVLARFCANCPACRRARRQQAGFAFALVKHVETKICPACRAYQKVTGRPAHQPTSPPRA